MKSMLSSSHEIVHISMVLKIGTVKELKMGPVLCFYQLNSQVYQTGSMFGSWFNRPIRSGF